LAYLLLRPSSPPPFPLSSPFYLFFHTSRRQILSQLRTSSKPHLRSDLSCTSFPFFINTLFSPLEKPTLLSPPSRRDFRLFLLVCFSVLAVAIPSFPSTLGHSYALSVLFRSASPPSAFKALSSPNTLKAPSPRDVVCFFFRLFLPTAFLDHHSLNYLRVSFLSFPSPLPFSWVSSY